MINMFQFFLGTPEKVFFNDQVHACIIPGRGGYFEVLKDHAALIAAVKEGTVTIIDKNRKKSTLQVSGGIFEVHSNNASLLADTVTQGSK